MKSIDNHDKERGRKLTQGYQT